MLTTGYWPSPAQAPENLLIPAPLQALQDHFTSFYTHKYQGRRLVWAHALERCVLVTHFPKGKKELEVSYYQALVLMAYNSLNFDDLSISDIRYIHCTLLSH